MLERAAAATEVLKDDGHTRVVAFEHGGRRWVIKWYAAPRMKVALYHALRCTPAWREWRGYSRLARAGIRTASPLGLIHGGNGLWRQGLIAGYVEGLALNHYLARDTLTHRQRAALARRVGQQVGQMTAAGIINRDHKAANLIVDPLCAAGDGPPVVIDPAGLRRRRSDRQVYRMLAMLYFTASRLCPVSPPEALRCLRSALEADHSLAASDLARLRTALRATQLEYRLLIS